MCAVIEQLTPAVCVTHTGICLSLSLPLLCGFAFPLPLSSATRVPLRPSCRAGADPRPGGAAADPAGSAGAGDEAQGGDRRADDPAAAVRDRHDAAQRCRPAHPVATAVSPSPVPGGGSPRTHPQRRSQVPPAPLSLATCPLACGFWGLPRPPHSLSGRSPPAALWPSHQTRPSLSHACYDIAWLWRHLSRDSCLDAR